MRTFLHTLICVAMICLSTSAFSQTCPPNIDFETGDFSNWECFTGFTRVGTSGQNEMVLTPSAPVPGRHEIISATTAPQLDQYGEFPKLCPYGGDFSVRLGNNSTGSQAEGLSYTFQVPTTVDTFTFTYFYAVVFESPGHPAPQQPRFFVTAYDVATGNLINCASFDYVSSSTIPGFKISRINRGVLYKDWTPASLQFAGLSGRTVRLEFKTADCTIGGHFGYTYIDVASACSNILANAPYCIETNSLTLNAPYGFQSYTWYNSTYSTIIGTQQTVTLSPPPVTSGVFYVDMVPYPGFGCRDTLQAIVTPLPTPDTPKGKSYYVYCQSQTATALTATSSPGHTLLWYTSATGGVWNSSPPIPTTTSTGETDYYVSQKALYGCESLRKKITIKVSPTPLTSFGVNTAKQCQNGNQFIFTSTSTNLSNAVCYWDFGDGQQQSSLTNTVVTHTYANAGNFVVKLKVVNDSTCAAEKTLSVSVIPKPVASFSYPATICEQQTSLAFTDNSTVPGGVSVINQWWWNINGIIATVKSPASVTANTPGPLPVQFVVKTAEGCVSDTNNTIVNVRYRPPAQFTMGTLMCDNEIISFTDQSQMLAAATGESIVKWQWLFNNTSSSTAQNPSLVFASGTHSASLITETNYGCKSLPQQIPFTIFRKPSVLLEKNDSCVKRNIIFLATDLAGNVSRWVWDFGNVPFDAFSQVNRTYPFEGTYPLTLLTYTANGCKDTIERPFTIYDNKAFAGKDTVAAIDETIQLNANGGANVTYLWTPSIGLNSANIENPVAVLSTDQRYELFAVTDKGCDSRSSILIRRFAGPTIYIPSAFTPNRDNKNDVLKVVPIGMRVFKYFAIFNRYGEMIYKSTDLSKGWDGTYKGAPQATGTFVVLAEAIDYRGRPVVQKATVTIIR